MNWRDECLLNAMSELEFVADAVGLLAFVFDEADEEAVGDHDDGDTANGRKGNAGAGGRGLEMEMILYEVREVRAEPDERYLGEDQEGESITRPSGHDDAPGRGIDAAIKRAGQDCGIGRASANHQVAEKTEDAKQKKDSKEQPAQPCDRDASKRGPFFRSGSIPRWGWGQGHRQDDNRLLLSHWLCFFRRRCCSTFALRLGLRGDLKLWFGFGCREVQDGGEPVAGVGVRVGGDLFGSAGGDDLSAA